MKKKILLMLAVMAMIVCIFAISVSAATVKFNGKDYEVTTYDDVVAKTNIDVTNTDDVVIFEDGFCCPTAYVFKDQNYVNGDGTNKGDAKNAFDFGYIYEKTNKEYTFGDIRKLDIPQGVVTINKRAFQEVTTLVEVSIPSSVTTIEHSAFEAATNLKRCTFEHGENDKLTTLSNWMFYSCNKLEAMSIPDCVTTIDGQCFLGKCTSLSAVYLSKNLVSFSYTGGSSHEGPFNECAKMYLVNAPFSYDNIPAKPDVYFFPSALSSTNMTGVFFRNCSSLNKILVFGKDVTALSNTSFLEGCGNETVVFLGDMTNVSATSSWPWSTKNIYFANENDKSAEDLETLSFNSSTQSVIFCYADGNTIHLKNPRKSVTTKEPTCVDNAWENTYCFCGAYIGEVEIENSNDGEKHDLENATEINIVYDDFTSIGTKILKCPKCGDESIAGGEAPALFICQGYSAPENGTGGIALGFTVNNVAIAEYEEVTGKTIKYGVFAASQEKLQDGNIFENGVANENVVCAEIKATDFAAFEIKVIGITDDKKDVPLALGAYVEVTKENTTEYSYMQATDKGEKSGNYYFVSYNDIVK